MTVFLILKCSEMLNFRRLPPREKNLQVEDFPEALNLEFFSPGDSQPGVFEKTPGSNLEKKHWLYPYGSEEKTDVLSGSSEHIFCEGTVAVYRYSKIWV